jgi:hypothetical protein
MSELLHPTRQTGEVRPGLVLFSYTYYFYSIVSFNILFSPGSSEKPSHRGVCCPCFESHSQMGRLNAMMQPHLAFWLRQREPERMSA